MSIDNNQNVLLNFANLTEDDITKIGTDFMSHIEKINTIIQTTDDDKLSWDTTFGLYADLKDSNFNKGVLCLQYLSPSKIIRQHCSKIDSKISMFLLNQTMKQSVYKKYKYYYDHQYNTEKLSQEQKSFAKYMIENYYKNYGIELSTEKLERAKSIRKGIYRLGSKFDSNLKKETKIFYFTETELSGLPDEFIAKRKMDDKKIKVTSIDYMKIMKYAKNRDIRKQIYIEHHRRCINSNAKIANKIILLRHELAKLLNYDCYNDVQLSNTIAENTENLSHFLYNLYDKLKPLLKRDLCLLKELAKEDTIDSLEIYDTSYYSNMYIDKIDLKPKPIKTYFTIDKLICGTFEIFQKILSYKFKKIVNMDHTFWHSDIELYEVLNLDDIVIGYFYLDLYERDGKRDKCVCYNVINKSKLTLPVAILSCLFKRNDITFFDVKSFFHEFGHVMHHLSSKSEIGYMSGFHCEFDFVETPSQLFEGWCYHADVLKKISNDLPNEEILRLQKKRNIMSGLIYTKKIILILTKLMLHLNPCIKTFAHFHKRLINELLELNIPENINFATSCKYLYDDHSHDTFTYLLSEIYAKDLFTRFENDLFNSDIGSELRDKVLAYGLIRSSVDSMTEFLGRVPNIDAFIKNILL